MKIIEAFWEKRNLGVSCSEVIIEQADSIHDLQMALANLKNTEYVVFKVPSGHVDYLKYLTDHGFYCIETLTEMSLDIANYSIPKSVARFDEKISYRLLPSSDLNTLGYEIKKGIFNSDRIALDPRFGIDMSANRYFNWIKDEASKGNNIYEIFFKEKPIGFFALKQINQNSFDNFLAGMYVNNSNFGFGFSILSKSIEEIKKRHGKYSTTHISSNNLSVIRLYAQFGFMPNNLSYVLIKHLY